MRETLIKLSPQLRNQAVARWELRLEPAQASEIECRSRLSWEGRPSRAQVYEPDYHLRQRRANFARWENSSTIFQLITMFSTSMPENRDR